MGYLTAVEPAGIEDAFEKVLSGDYLVEERMALEVELAGTAPRPVHGIERGDRREDRARDTRSESRSRSPAVPS